MILDFVGLRTSLQYFFIWSLQHLNKSTVNEDTFDSVRPYVLVQLMILYDFRFRGTPYKSTVNEDTPVGTTIFSAIEVTIGCIQ